MGYCKLCLLKSVLGKPLSHFCKKCRFLKQRCPAFGHMEGEKLRKSVLSDLSEKNFPLVSAFLKQKKPLLKKICPAFRQMSLDLSPRFGYPKFNFESSKLHEISNLKNTKFDKILKILDQICPAFDQMGVFGFSEPRKCSICADLGSDARGGKLNLP